MLVTNQQSEVKVRKQEIGEERGDAKIAEEKLYILMFSLYICLIFITK